MPILIGFCLHQNFLYVLVGSFYYTIHLTTVRNRILVFGLELLAKLLNYFPIQIISIICNELCWHAIATNDVLFQESAHHSLGDTFVGNGFYPFGEVIDGHKNILMPIRGFWNHGSDDIHSPPKLKKVMVLLECWS